jgi:hypothetical protein
MSKMNNFYELFDVQPNASYKQIIMGYENKITKYNNLTKLTKEQIYNIKMLKIGLHILINPNLRAKYNKLLIGQADNKAGNKPGNKADNKLGNKPDNEPIALNAGNDDNLDLLFNIDNSWMKQVNINLESSQANKKNNFETNIGDRIFSLSNFNKRPGFSTDFEAELRKPLQGREDKSNQTLNKNKM